MGEGLVGGEAGVALADGVVAQEGGGGYHIFWWVDGGAVPLVWVGAVVLALWACVALVLGAYIIIKNK